MVAALSVTGCSTLRRSMKMCWLLAMQSNDRRGGSTLGRQSISRPPRSLPAAKEWARRVRQPFHAQKARSSGPLLAPEKQDYQRCLRSSLDRSQDERFFEHGVHPRRQHQRQLERQRLAPMALLGRSFKELGRDQTGDDPTDDEVGDPRSHCHLVTAHESPPTKKLFIVYGARELNLR
jgi:hypothetical protein